VVCALALSLAYPLRELFAQRAEIAALHEHIADQRAEVAALEATKARWEDPAYVKAQARERLHFVMPGETQYVVVDPPPAEADGARARGGGSTTAASADEAWFARLWASTQQSARS
jgi:hypothetical protein